MDWLKEVLKDYVAEDKISEVIEKHNKELPKYFVPSGKYKTATEEIRDYKTKLEESSKKLEENSKKLEEVNKKIKNASENEDSQNAIVSKELEELKSQFESYKTDIIEKETNRQKLGFVEKGLTKAGINPDVLDLIANTFNLQEIKVDESGNIEGWEDRISSLKESKPSIFKTEEISSAGKPKDGTSANVTKEQFDNMDYNAKVDLFNNNKALYDTLSKQGDE